MVSYVSVPFCKEKPKNVHRQYFFFSSSFIIFSTPTPDKHSCIMLTDKHMLLTENLLTRALGTLKKQNLWKCAHLSPHPLKRLSIIRVISGLPFLLHFAQVCLCKCANEQKKRNSFTRMVLITAKRRAAEWCVHIENVFVFSPARWKCWRKQKGRRNNLT